MNKACGRVKGRRAIVLAVPRSDPERLAAALRENLKKRKQQARAHVAEPSFGADEEGAPRRRSSATRPDQSQTSTACSPTPTSPPTTVPLIRMN